MNNGKGKKTLMIIVLTSIAILLFSLLLGAGTDNPVIFLVGMGLFFLMFIAGISVINAGNKASGGKTSGESKKNALKYEPLLLDERTKQDPDVQRLLQYTSVQKVFFDPEYLKTVAAQTDPYVIELLGVFDNIISSRTLNGDYPLYPNQSGLNGTNAYTNALIQNEIKRRENEKKKPRRIVGRVLTYVGLGLFVIPFFVIMFLGMNSPESTGAVKSASIFLTSAAPLGMMLIVIGSILRK